MIIFAIDPGSEQSAYVVYRTERTSQAGTTSPPTILHKGIEQNKNLIRSLWRRGEHPYSAAVIERVASYGMAVGEEVFETVHWSGRMFQSLVQGGLVPYRMFRREVKIHLCGNNSAKDANIRQALIDRFGPGKEKAIGLKSSPGPLHGVSKDVWSALALAVTYADLHAPNADPHQIIQSADAATEMQQYRSNPQIESALRK